MKRYINADVAIYKIVTNKNFINGDKYPHDCCCDIIEAIPTADVVEVVRCKDCKHKGGNGYDEDVCWEIEPQHGVYVSDNWYCADGERRE